MTLLADLLEPFTHRCDRCNRGATAAGRCGMAQPNGERCAGTFREPTHNPAAAVERERRRVAERERWDRLDATADAAIHKLARLSAWTAGEYAGER